MTQYFSSQELFKNDKALFQKSLDYNNIFTNRIPISAVFTHIPKFYITKKQIINWILKMTRGINYVIYTVIENDISNDYNVIHIMRLNEEEFLCIKNIDKIIKLRTFS